MFWACAVRRRAKFTAEPPSPTSPLQCPFRLRASVGVGGLGALRPYFVGYPILDNCEIWRPHAPVRAERLNGRVLSWMLGLACRLSYLGGGRSCGERRSDAFITFECGRSGQNRASRRARRRRGRREIGNAHQAARAAQGRSGSEPKEDGDEQSHEFFNENDNWSLKRKRKGASRFTAMIGSRPCAPERTKRAGRSD